MSEVLFNIIIYPIIQIVEFIFVVAQTVFKNTGFSVMCISVAVTVLCLPLYDVAERWQELERQTQKRLKSGVERIKAAFKGDEQYMIMSVFYKQNHYHPIMALRSSFGLLIQVPFFIAAYSYLSHLEILCGTPFLFIRDLGAPDAMLKLGGGGGDKYPSDCDDAYQLHCRSCIHARLRIQGKSTALRHGAFVFSPAV
ncbi:MAG: hypothetical protein ACTTI0_00535 [Treponema sp.]